MSIFHDVPTPLSFANKKNKIELVKIVKDVPKDIIDGTGACPVALEDGTRVAPADCTRACPVGSENRTGAVKKNKNETHKFNPVPLFIK